MAEPLRPWRTGAGARPAVRLPPQRMPRRLGTRPLKRWRWVGVFDEAVLLCAAVVEVGPVPVAWWAVWERETGTLTERTMHRRGRVGVGGGRVRVADGPVVIDLALSGGEPVETVSPHGRAYAWTAKRPVAATGRVRVGDREHAVEGRGLVDDSAGYHARRTAWRWSTGVGETIAGDPVTWNLCEGLHDDPRASENTVWVAGVPHAVGPVRFGVHGPGGDEARSGGSVPGGDPLLAGVAFAEGGALSFSAEAARSHREDRWLVASDYEAPFGRFSGALPVAGELRGGLGVMERHAARW